MDYQEAERIHSNKNHDLLPFYIPEPDFRPRTRCLKERPGPHEEGLYNTITCMHSNYSFRLPQRKLHWKKGEKSDHSDIWNCRTQDLRWYWYLKHDHDNPLRIRINEDQPTDNCPDSAHSRSTELVDPPNGHFPIHQMNNQNRHIC